MVAKKGSCVTQLNEYGFCPDQHWNFAIGEVLKGSSSPNRTFRGDWPCGLNFGYGENYLLFLSEYGKPSICNGSVSLDISEPEYVAGTRRLWPGVIRDYRDGVSKDLSGPWIFTDNGSFCSIQHSLKGAYLAFTYWYAEAEEWSEKPVFSVRGTKPEPRVPTFEVTFHHPQDIVTGSAIFKVGGSRWQLYRRTLAIIIDSMMKPIEVNSEVIVGAPVLDLLKAMSKPIGIELFANREVKFSVPLRTTKNEDNSIQFMSRTTRLSNSADKFLSCVNSAPRK